MSFATRLLRRRPPTVSPVHVANQGWINRCFFSGNGIDTTLLQELPEGVWYPAGWMNTFDLKILYNLAIVCAPPFLEIGPWIGRSTTAICAGIRDSTSDDKTFDILDFGICGIEEWKERFGYIPDFDLPDHVKGHLKESITAPGGTLAVLIANLQLNGFLRFTTSIMRGDWVSCPHARKYHFVFIDAVHNRQEAERHLPKLRENLADGALVVVDDVVDADFAKLVCGMLNMKRWVLTSSLNPENKLMLAC